MDTIFAPLTPIVNSSVILVRLSGNHVHKAFNLFKTKSSKLSSFEHAKVYHLNFYHNNKPIDDVVAYFFKGPKSYTGEDVLEISFHGNPKLIAMAFDEFKKLGFRFAEPGEFTKRAFLNGKLDLSQAEAVNEIISAKSDFAVMRSFEQLQGELKDNIYNFKNLLLEVLSIVEVFVDFPDEDIDVEQIKFCESKLENLLNEIESLLFSFEKMRYFKSGASVAIIGKPNVGKSSLLNALLDKNRAIVSDIPGTTRDFIEETIMVKELPIRFIDTAGVRDADSHSELKGIDLTFDKIEKADLIILVLDCSANLDAEDRQLIDLVSNKNKIILGNKVDKFIDNDFKCDLYISAKNREGITDLLDLVYEKIIGLDFDKYNHSFLITERHYNSFKEVKVILENLLNNFNTEQLDLISIDLHYCLDKITEITGQKYTNELLDNIFSKFCIGK